MVYDLRVAGVVDRIGVTALHPFCSVDRNDWIPVSELLYGERLAIEGATGVVLGVTERGYEPVINLEVEADHCYRVGEQGVLVHNASAPCNPCKNLSKARSVMINGCGTNTFTSNVQVGVDSGGKDITYGGSEIVKQGDDGAKLPVVCRVNSITGTVAGRGTSSADPCKTTRNAWPQELMREALLIPLGCSFNSTYQAGHLIGLSYGGPESVYALVPQNFQLNQGYFAAVPGQKSPSGWFTMGLQIKQCLTMPCITSAKITDNSKC